VTDHFLALDAGNSKTVAVVVDAGGGVLGRGRGGRGDIYNATTPDTAAEAVISTARAALAEAGIGPEALTAAAFRMAGVDWPEDTGWWRSRIAAKLVGLQRFSVANDGFATLRLGMLDGVGLAITVGTGPAIAARSRDGLEACSGWWVFDNLGGWGLAEGAITAVCLAWMGLGESTALTERLLQLFEAEDPYELRHSFTRRDRQRPADDELRATRSVLEIAEAGDPVALGLVHRQAEAFVGYAGWVAARVGSTPGPDFPVVLNGSVVTSEHGVLRRALLERIAHRFPSCPVKISDAPPLAGCTLDAFTEGGMVITEQLRDAVVGVQHPPEFLGT
jgi:N-acetylglucosamine kinase-like BadF-type ATPase